MNNSKGLNVKFIISKKPITASVTERSIPISIFGADDVVKKKYLRKWTGDAGLADFDLRSILDWDYYKDRLAGTIQKIVTIPAALQHCLNPVPEIQYPEWLHKRIKVQNDKFKQKKLSNFF
jgi:DNA polymerase epsilon subunit 1